MNNKLYISTTGIVADSSVIINLSGTGYSKQILVGMPFPVVITPQVQKEIYRGKSTGRTDYLILDDLLHLNVIQIHSLEEQAGEVFLDLVSGRTMTSLDDGEASTIAVAQVKDLTAAIDERKASRICEQHFPLIKVVSTVDIIACSHTARALSESQIADALRGALENSRMRVLPRNYEWVCAIIGEDNVSKYPGLRNVFTNPHIVSPGTR